MYAFAQRSDTRVFDEPLYAHYLHTKYDAATHNPHPDTPAIIAAMSTDSDHIIKNIILGPCDAPVLFMKHMAHHLHKIDRTFLHHTTNILLIRDPRDMLPSLAKIIGTPTLADTGLQIQHTLLSQLRTAGQNPPILDAQLLLENPTNVLAQLCERLHLRFRTDMLSWEPGGNPADGVWAPHWYQNVHRSTGFQPYRPKPDPFPAALEPLLETCTPYYESLRRDAIRP